MSYEDRAFVPRWASPPGDTVRALLKQKGFSPSELARVTKLGSARVERLLSGAEPISIEVARALERTLGGSVGFWVARDGQYRDDLARLDADRWCQTLPINDMARLGWIDEPGDWTDRIDAALRFFNVATVESWRQTYGETVERARLRTSESSPPDKTVLAAWLRQAQIEADHLELDAWDPARFRAALADMRKLTTTKDPKRFIPRLQEIAAMCGVACVVVRAPRGCNVSGAATFISGTHGLMALSARYLSDDHFWFTLFHEAGHLLLHSAGTFIDDLPRIYSDDIPSYEHEADVFAESVLFPGDAGLALNQLRLHMRDVVRFAHEIKIAPGIVVGQLQFRRRLGFGSGLNHLKRRYEWSGITLETRRTA